MSVKSIMKWAVKRGVALCGGLWRQSGSRVLTYHSVGHREHEMNVTPEAFEGQMAWLADHYPIVTLDEAVERPCTGIAITFDDGYLDNLWNAVPVLVRLNIPATFFIVAGRVGGRLEHDRGRPHSELMNWDDLRALLGSGRFCVGSHTLTHGRLSALPIDAQHREIFESRNLLADRFGAISAFAYPFGSALDYTTATIDLVREAGFRYAMSNRYGVIGEGDSRWECRRIWVDRTDSAEMFRAKVAGALDGLAFLDSWPGIRIRRWMNALAGS